MKFDQVTRGTVGGFGGQSKDAQIFEKALESGSDCLITGKACAEGVTLQFGYLLQLV